MSGQDGLMLIVVLDTNALHTDAWLTGQRGIPFVTSVELHNKEQAQPWAEGA
jgi:hypothetical protein